MPDRNKEAFFDRLPDEIEIKNANSSEPSLPYRSRKVNQQQCLSLSKAVNSRT